ncbi:unnamed protein product [Gadus morhua 'NCC']
MIETRRSSFVGQKVDSATELPNEDTKVTQRSPGAMVLLFGLLEMPLAVDLCKVTADITAQSSDNPDQLRPTQGGGNASLKAGLLWSLVDVVVCRHLSNTQGNLLSKQSDHLPPLHPYTPATSL